MTAGCWHTLVACSTNEDENLKEELTSIPLAQVTEISREGAAIGPGSSAVSLIHYQDPKRPPE